MAYQVPRFKPQSPITKMLHGLFSQGIPTYVAYKMAEKTEQDKWKKLKEEWKQQALLKEIDYYADIVTDTKNPPTIRGQAARQMEELLDKTPYSAVMGGGGGVTSRPQAFPTVGNAPSYPEDKLRVSGMPTLGRPNPFSPVGGLPNTWVGGRPAGMSTSPLIGEGMPARRPALSEMLSNMPAQEEPAMTPYQTGQLGLGKERVGLETKRTGLAITKGEYEIDMNLISQYYAKDDQGNFTTPYEVAKGLEPRVREACIRQGTNFVPRLPAEKRPGIFLKDLPERLGEPGPQTKYTVGQIIEKAGKKWKILYFDTDGEPIVEEIK